MLFWEERVVRVVLGSRGTVAEVGGGRRRVVSIDSVVSSR